MVKWHVPVWGDFCWEVGSNAEKWGDSCIKNERNFFIILWDSSCVTVR